MALKRRHFTINWSILAGLAGVFVATLFMGPAAYGQSCPPCGEYETVVERRRQLEEAFSLSLTVPDCLGVSNLNTCRKIEEILEEVTRAIDFILTSKIPEDEANCLSCDPKPNFISLTHGLNSLTYFLLDNGYGDPSFSHEKRLAKLKAWRDYRCPCSAPEGVAMSAPEADPEANARDELGRKCGPKFTKRRKGLRQVLRVPDDRPGCYQSRKCRGAVAYKGFDAEPGFWSYDGEYWYIWAERLGTAGEWIECIPEAEDP